NHCSHAGQNPCPKAGRAAAPARADAEGISNTAHRQKIPNSRMVSMRTGLARKRRSAVAVRMPRIESMADVVSRNQRGMSGPTGEKSRIGSVPATKIHHWPGRLRSRPHSRIESGNQNGEAFAFPKDIPKRYAT